mmetsp:Transcript_13853/g.26077  ORF Transcript_13853/g.26077 Transcript_13853/m.26077 type:complete len:194 (-) Transcript_13853:147-728(-)
MSVFTYVPVVFGVSVYQAAARKETSRKRAMEWCCVRKLWVSSIRASAHCTKTRGKYTFVIRSDLNLRKFNQSIFSMRSLHQTTVVVSQYCDEPTYELCSFHLCIFHPDTSRKRIVCDVYVLPLRITDAFRAYEWVMRCNAATSMFSLEGIQEWFGETRWFVRGFVKTHCFNSSFAITTTRLHTDPHIMWSAFQ